MTAGKRRAGRTLDRHRCTACGRPTRRRPRMVPVHDGRCSACVRAGHRPRHTEEVVR